MIDQIFVSYEQWKKLKEYYLTKAGIDPNDVQATCDHRKYDIATDSCQICGKDWNTILWQGVPGRCCPSPLGNEPAQFSGGKWHQIDCNELKPKTTAPQHLAEIDYRPKPGGHRCECGGWATSNPNAHAFYCPEYKK